MQMPITDHHEDSQASPWLCRHAQHIRPQGRVLDVAAGTGRNARWLAQQGFKVEAVDYNAEALSSMHGIARITTRIADLENSAWPYAGQKFNAIVVCRYLHRPLLPLLTANLMTQGVLIYETFMRGHEAYGRPQNPDFLLRSNELLHVFSTDLTIIAFEQGKLEQTPPAIMQRICAIKP
jgi:SAM-dependent methyltransferase